MGAKFTIVPHGEPENGRVRITLHYEGRDGFRKSYEGYSGGPNGGPYPGLLEGYDRNVGAYVRMPTLSAKAGRDLYGIHIGGNYLIHGNIGSKGCPAIYNFDQLVSDVRAHGMPDRLVSRPRGRTTAEREPIRTTLQSNGVSYSDPGSSGIDGWLDGGDPFGPADRSYQPPTTRRERIDPTRAAWYQRDSSPQRTSQRTASPSFSSRGGLDGWMDFGPDAGESRSTDTSLQRSEVRYAGTASEPEAPRTPPGSNSPTHSLYGKDSPFNRG